MNDTDKILINAYLDNETSPEENNYVDELIKSDADAHNYFNLIKRANIDIENFYQDAQIKRKDLSKIEYSVVTTLFSNFFNRNFLSYSLTAVLFLGIGFNINLLYNTESDLNTITLLENFSDKNIQFDYIETKSISNKDLDQMILDSIQEMIELETYTASVNFGDEINKITLSSKIIDGYNVVCFRGEILNKDGIKKIIFCNNNNILSVSFE